MHRIATENCPSLAALYVEAARRYAALPAFGTRLSRGQWQATTFAELGERGRALAAGLIEHGVKAGDRVGLFADNRVEWMVAEWGIQFAAAISVPRGTDVPDGELAHIIRHSGLRVALVDNPAMLKRVQRVAEELAVAVTFILLEQTGSTSGVADLAVLESSGRQRLATGAEEQIRERISSIGSDSPFTLIYTSGTTGEPKGVPLTHGNMLSQIRNIPIDFTSRDRVLSLLPVWHVYERVFEMLTISAGACTYYSAPRHYLEDLQDVEPTFMGSAPRLWESLHDRIHRRIAESHPVRRGLFHIARFLAKNYHRSVAILNGRELRVRPIRPLFKKLRWGCHALRWLLLLPLYGFFNAAVLERIRVLSTGSAMKATISGGGALPPAIDQFFEEIGIRVLEGYGLTETSPVLAVRRPDKPVQGTVGPCIPETELRLVDPESGRLIYPDPNDPALGRMRQGEIQVRGPQVMPGYYENPAANAAAFDGDWFRTGDLGVITWNDCLKIVGRCKDTIVLSSGENVEPVPMEALLNASAFIDQCMVVGQDWRHLGLLVVPAENLRRRMSDPAGREEVSAVLHREVRSLISRERGFRSFERIHELALLDEPFESGVELTNLGKLKRHVILQKRTAALQVLAKRLKA